MKEETFDLVIADNSMPVQIQQPAIIFDDTHIRTKIEAFIKPYKEIDVSEISAENLKMAKSARAEMRNFSKQLNEARKLVKKTLNAPINAFEACVKDLDMLIQEPIAQIDNAIKALEAKERQERYDKLEQAYIDLAPLLAEYVKANVLIEDRWLNKSFGETKAMQALEDKVSAIARDWEALKSTQLFNLVEAEHHFFKDFDLAGAIAYDRAHAQEVKAIEEMKQEVSRYGGKVEELHTYTFTIEATQEQYKSVLSFIKSQGIHGKVGRR